MNKSSKKMLSLFLSLTIFLGCFSVGWAVYGIDKIEIDEINFPDPVFRQIVEKYDKDASGFLENDELANVPSSLTITGYTTGGAHIKTLKGVEFFADTVETLRCTDVFLEELDVSALYKLNVLTCMSNRLTSLDVSKNTALTRLNCSGNKLETLNLGSVNTIVTLYCQTNKLKSIDVSKLTELVNFKCDQNELSALNLTANTKLKTLSCSLNHLPSLYLSQNTELTSVNDNDIGRQTVTAQAVTDGSKIMIPFAVSNYDCVTYTSLDTEEKSGFESGSFTVYDINDFSEGIDYNYSTQNANSVDMSVHIDVTRDFYQVSFYTDETMQSLAGRRFVNANGIAGAPNIAAPQCKVFDSWSSDFSNVTSDIDAYPIWKDSHTYAVTNFEDGIATITCNNNDDSYTVVFEDCINATSGDDNYCEYLDVVADGYINAKDYAKLIKMF